MQDRYLFRGKRAGNGEWVIWDAITGIPHDLYIQVKTICQCTGLKDKHGNLIWENDIVSYCDCTKEDYVISWEQNKACFEYQQYSCSMMNFDELSSCEVEVVGNVFDNPELLEM